MTMPTKDEVHKLAQDLGRRLTDEGKLVKAGWVLFEAYTMPPTAGADQRNDMRIAFFAGAEHVFHTILSIMEEGEEPTEADLSRMDKINDELMHFRKFLAAKMPPRN